MKPRTDPPPFPLDYQKPGKRRRPLTPTSLVMLIAIGLIILADYVINWVLRLRYGI